MTRYPSPEGASYCPMSPEQESVWLNDQFNDGASRYVESWVHRLSGAIDPDLIEAVLSTIVRRHESLRCALLLHAGRPVQVVTPPARVPLTIVDVSPEQVDEELRKVVGQHIALDEPPLLRATLLRLNATESILAVAVHHAAIDGWCFRLLDLEFSELYEAASLGRSPHLPEPVPRFTEFAAEQPAGLDRDLAHWRTVLSGAPAESAFPSDRNRPTVLRPSGDQVEFVIGESLAAAVKDLARSLRTTSFAVFATATTALLSRLTDQADVVIGTPVSRRDRPELESMIACLADLMPLRQRMPLDQPFRSHVLALKEQVWQAIEHRSASFGRLVRAIGTERTLSRFPLFQVVVTVDDAQAPGLKLSGVRAERIYPHSGRAKFDAFFNFVPVYDGYRGFLQYSTDLLDRESAERLTRRFLTILADACARPDHPVRDLQVMPEEERALIERAAQCHDPGAVPPPVHEMVSRWAADTPDSPAVSHGPNSMTYRELEQAADALASRLTALGLRGRPVAVALDRGLHVAVAVLGVLRAGCPVVPIAACYPEERISFMIEDSGAAALVARSSCSLTLKPPERVVPIFLEALPTGSDFDPPAVSGDDLAYVIYTSGSTGVPKGAAMPHSALANLIAWQRRDSACGPGARTLQFAPLSFDVAFQEMFATWSSGGELVVADEETRRNPELLLDLIDHRAIDRLFLPFVALRHLADYAVAEQRHLTLKEVITAGEQLFITPMIRRVFSELTTASLQNQYGPAETHVVTAETMEGPVPTWPDRPSIGRPIPGARVQVCDDRLRPRPIGVTGEICVGGRPLAHGYLGRAADAGGGFVLDPRTGDRVYRTGDFGRLRHDGRIEFIGRVDGQVKIRGHRVEPGEVESVVKALPGVADAVVAVLEGADGTRRRLAAYYIPAVPGDDDAESVRARLRQRLPEHLVPSSCVPVPEFPLTPSGKVDRAALVRTRPAGSPRNARPLSAVERRMAAVWADVLQLDLTEITPEADFFELGGDSLAATSLTLAARAEFGVRIPLSTVCTMSSLAGLTTLITGAPDVGDPPDLLRQARLPADIVPARRTAPAEGTADVLLTGATGFLGAFLLRDLLEQTTARVRCLVRADDATRARARLEDVLNRYGITAADCGKRVSVVPGDLSLPRFGVTDRMYEELSRTVEAIYHCGAAVNLAQSYARLKGANVTGTIEVLRLAARSGAAVHHVSTVGVFSGARPAGGHVGPEDPLPPPGGLRHGYTQSKWVAESLMRQARARDIPVTVYRPTRVAGATTTGACQEADYLWLLLKGCVEAQAAPAGIDPGFDLVPVDYVSGAIVTLSRLPRAAGRTHHLSSEQPVRLSQALQWLRARGYRIAEVAAERWVQVIESDPANAAFPLLDVMRAEAGDGDLEAGAIFDSATTRQALGAGCPPVDQRLFDRYTDYFVASGFLPDHN